MTAVCSVVSQVLATQVCSTVSFVSREQTQVTTLSIVSFGKHLLSNFRFRLALSFVRTTVTHALTLVHRMSCNLCGTYGDP